MGLQYTPQTGLSQTSATTVNVRRVEQPVIWITLPGDIASHKLTEAQAKELFRKLEEVV
jgi:hypothetical protein